MTEEIQTPIQEQIQDQVEIPQIFNEVQEQQEQQEQPEEQKQPDSIPKYYEEGWHDYVMSQFLPNELENEHPTCDGLRRVTEKLIGPIIERHITHIVPLKNLGDSETGAVAVRVVVAPRSFVEFERSNLIEESVADINKQNTELKFYLYPLSTAETRAEARALRKILRLRKTIAAEEVSEVNEEKLQELIPWNPADLISDEQKNAIDIMAKRLNVNVLKFINAGKKQYASINEITKEVASQMIQHLNKYQRQVLEIPPHIAKYDENWQQ